MKIKYNDFIFSDDKSLISIDKICKMLKTTYWANKRGKSQTIKAIENSICIGIYKDTEMVGFARLVTDYATMYWLADVIIDEKHRGKGLGKKLIEIATSMKEIKCCFGLLATNDAHELYGKYGFVKVGEKYMRKNVEEL